VSSLWSLYLQGKLQLSSMTAHFSAHYHILQPSQICFTKQQLCSSTTVLTLAGKPIPQQGRAIQCCSLLTISWVKLSVSPRWCFGKSVPCFDLLPLWEVSCAFCPSPPGEVSYVLYGVQFCWEVGAICPPGVLDYIVPSRKVICGTYLLELQIYSGWVGSSWYCTGKLCFSDSGPVHCRI
jgi:hypothetical protein